MSPSLMEQALALPLEERRKLMRDLWRAVDEESPVESISEDERHLLDERSEAAQAHPNDVEPWSVVRERLLGDR